MTFPYRLGLLTVAIVVAQAGFGEVSGQTIGQPYGGLPAAPRLPTGVAVPAAPEPPTRDATESAEGEKPSGWMVTPYASLREAFTDNVRLQPHGTSDFITSATPGVAVQGKTRRLQTTLDGNVTYDYHARASDLDGYRYNFYGNGLGEIVEKYLFLDVRSSVSAEAVTTNGGISGFDRSLPGNQVQVINTSISPYLAHDFGSFASGELRYRASVLNYSDANTNSQARSPTSTGTTPVNLNDSTTNEVLAILKAGPEFNVFRWQIDGSASETEYENNRTIERSSATLAGEYALMREVAVLAKVGEDSFKDSAVASRDDLHPSWRLGTRLTPGPRSELLLEGGSRYGGDYWSGQLRYKISEVLNLTALHSETVATQQQLSSDGLNQSTRDAQGRLVDPLTGAIINPNASPFNYVDQSFALETSRISLSGTSERNSYNISAEYDERTIGATSLDQPGQRTQNVWIVGGTLARLLTQVSDASVSMSYATNDDSLSTGSYDIFQAGSAYNYDFSASLRGSLAYRFYSLSNTVGSSYEENSVLATIRKNF